MASNSQFRNLSISSYVAGCVFFLLGLFLLKVLVQKKVHNRYTKIAYFELLFALFLRVVACFIFAKFTDSESLSSSLFDEIFFISPFYLVIKIAFALIFGWLTLY